MTITTTAFTNFRLTSAESLVLALAGARGATGLDLWGELSHPRLKEDGREVEAFISLERFGLIERVAWDKANPRKVRGYVLTAAGLERYEAGAKRSARFSGCPGCVLLECVCSYKLGCLAASDPVLKPEAHSGSLGCHGSHD